MVMMMGMLEKVAGVDEEADEYADEADGDDDVGTCYDAAAQYWFCVFLARGCWMGDECECGGVEEGD